MTSVPLPQSLSPRIYRFLIVLHKGLLEKGWGELRDRRTGKAETERQPATPKAHESAQAPVRRTRFAALEAASWAPAAGISSPSSQL